MLRGTPGSVGGVPRNEPASCGARRTPDGSMKADRLYRVLVSVAFMMLLKLGQVQPQGSGGLGHPQHTQPGF